MNKIPDYTRLLYTGIMSLRCGLYGLIHSDYFCKPIFEMSSRGGIDKKKHGDRKLSGFNKNILTGVSKIK